MLYCVNLICKLPLPPVKSIMATDEQVERPDQMIVFYTSRITPSCRAVRMLATHLGMHLDEVYLRCYIDTRTEKFRQVSGPSFNLCYITFSPIDKSVSHFAGHK